MRSVLALIFFLSGVSALIFESLWFRLAGLSLGNSVWSASLVLAAFMGGLALGNGLVARMHRRVVRPIRLYATLEIAIGIGGMAVVLILPGLPDLFGPLFASLTDLPLLLNAIRLTIAFGILLTPAIAMGATLPVLAEAFSRQDPNFGANIGWLYGWNTLGAMLGALCAEMFLVPVFGLINSGLLAMAFNVMAALIAIRYAKTNEPPPIAGFATPESPRSLDPDSRRYLVVAFLSGALMLALEVVWFRFLLLTRDGTSLIFAVMLAVVLGGIAVGGLAAAHLFQRDERAYSWLRPVIAGTAGLVVLTYWGYDKFSVYDNPQDISTAAFIGYATFLMFPVAALSGVAFTMTNRAIRDNVGSSARTAGLVTFSNTIGAMLGSLFGGFVLLPMVGMESSFFLIAVAYCGTALLVPPQRDATRTEMLSGRGALAMAMACLVLFPFGLMQKTFFRAEIAWLPGHSLVTAREGLVETVRYYRRDMFGEPKYYRLLTNGHSMSATSTAAKRYMKLYAYLPLAMNADTRDALLISYGVGSTAKALVDSRGLERIDVVDISEDILELSSTIYPGADNPLKDERVRVHVEDGRFFLNTSARRYDLITSEPPPPDHAGVVNLYSQEYFELIRSRLNPGGYSSYWLPAEQLGPINTLAIIRAFCNAFDDCSLWSGSGLEWMLMGSNGATRQSSVAQFSAQWNDPSVGRELVALGFESPAQMGSLFMADHELLMQLTADIAPVTDNFPSRITSGAVTNQGYVGLYDALMDEEARLERFRDSKQIAALVPTELRKGAEPYFPYERLIKNHFTAGVYRHPDEPFFWEAIDDLLTNTPLETLPLWLIGSDQDTQDIVASIVARDGMKDDLALQLARKYVAERDYATALRFVDTYMAAAGEVSGWTLRFNLYLLAKNDLLAHSGPVIERLEALGEPGTARFLEWLATRFESQDGRNPASTIRGTQHLTDAAGRP